MSLSREFLDILIPLRHPDNAEAARWPRTWFAVIAENRDRESLSIWKGAPDAQGVKDGVETEWEL